MLTYNDLKIQFFPFFPDNLSFGNPRYRKPKIPRIIETTVPTYCLEPKIAYSVSFAY